MLSFEITGTDRLERVARACDQAARGGLQRELRTQVSGSLRGLEQRTRDEMRGAMPARYATVLAADTTVKVQVTGAWPQVYATVSAGRRHLADVEAGTLRHPVFGRTRRGRRRPWVAQPVAGGFFAKASRAYLLNLRRAAELALREIAERIANA